MSRRSREMKQFIENNKKALVDEVEADVTSQILVNELARQYPMSPDLGARL
jgi:hypothetical protein